jgi:shikimate kinase
MDFKKGMDDKQDRPRVVEIVGPAGAGKTTLCKVLSHCGGSIRLNNFPDIRKVGNAPFFISNGFQLIPAVLHGKGQLSRREFAWLAILNGWPKVLQKELKKNNGIMVLDQGPVYLLTETNEFGPEFLRRKTAAHLWKKLYSQWAELLDMVVWLDAADTDLTERIRRRDKGHPVKDESLETTLDFLVSYRKAYRRTMSSLSKHHPDLKILWFNTSRESPEEIARRLLFELGLC